MDQEMTEAPLGLQVDLSCPVCQRIYRDPVLLQCTHSFCRECLQRSWETLGKKCPVCRRVFDGEEQQPVTNRALGDVCESFQRDWKPQLGCVVRDRCPLHREELRLFCMKDEEPVCVECVTQHQNHDLWPLKTALPYCQEQLSFKIKIFQNKVDFYKKTKHAFRDTVGFIKHQAEQATVQIKAEFERLHKVLVTEEVARLKALADEESEKVSVLEEMMVNISRDIASCSKIIENLKREMGDEDLKFLKNFKELKTRAQWPQEDPRYPAKSLLNMGKHVGSLSFNIWKNMQAHVTCNPVVLDPNTASTWLCLNSDLSSMKESQERQHLPSTPERFDPCNFILGSEGFSSGRHRWDVIVGDNPKWILGVCRESVARKKRFTVSPDRGMWVLALSKGAYMALTPERTQLELDERPERIRVKLDMDKGEVSFWDGESAKHLCTLAHPFNERMFPVFGPGLHSTPMVLAAAKIAVHTS